MGFSIIAYVNGNPARFKEIVKEVTGMKKTLLYVAPAFIFICFLGFIAMMVPDTVSAQTATGGICCINGQLTKATPNDCQAKGGRFFTNEHEAAKVCEQSAKCYCCDNGVSTLTTLGTCRIKNNPCYKTKQEATSLCLPPCFCCINGAVSQVSQRACKDKSGVCYTSLNDAKQRCQKLK